VSSFYPHFRRTPPPRAEIHVCRDVACFLAGAPRWAQEIRERVAGDEGIEVHEASCLGRCEIAPAALVHGEPVGAVAAEEVARRARAPAKEPRLKPAKRRRWRADPHDDAARHYSVLREWSRRPDAAEAAIATLQDARLRGMGGAGFPTGKKWEIVRGEAATPKYVVCNADESEPGTFKDRVLLDEVPHLVIEGMCIAARAVNATKGWIYLRHEYVPEKRTLRRALDDARERGVLGDPFDIELFISPGGYILGEETALLEALEDRRGEPRNKPPYPGQRGLFGKPTLINNVETLAFVPAILRHGAAWWKEQGTRGHAGLKFMAACGDVRTPGVYEIPMGTTVAELIERAGGMKEGKRLKAFWPGGASSNFLPADRADAEIDFD
ncbi:MAG: NAD(P)H-dependent oxidoreductase subunit E, partial [Gemmatimonadota bacterium]